MGKPPLVSLREAKVSLIDCVHRTPPFAGVGYPYITIPDLKLGRIRHAEARRISPEDYITWTQKAAPRPYDVVLSRRCNPGETAVVPPGLEFALGQNLVLLRADGTKVFPPFLRWLVQGNEWWQEVRKFNNVGAVFDSLKCADIPNFRLPIPSLPEQHTIADVLCSLDEKIELNRRMNETLEAMARAIFKSWFIDFDPVRAKAEGRQPYGMDAQTAALFPSDFQNSALGRIPKEWKVDHPNSFCGITIGGDWGEDVAFDGAVQVVCLRGVDLEHLRRDGYAGAPLRWVKPASLARRALRDSDILIAASGIGPVGRSLRVVETMQKQYGNPVTYSNFCKRLEVATPEHASYFDRWLYEMHRSNEIWEYVNGTSIPNLDANGLISRMLIVIPPRSLLLKYHEFVAPVYARLFNQESQTLATIRDTLLPKLISGEIRIKDVEKMIVQEV